MNAVSTPRDHLVTFLRITALVLGAVNAGCGVSAQAMGADGVNYLDQGDA